MFLALLLNVFKKLAPFLLIAALFCAVWFHGYHYANRQSVEREARIAAESNQITGAALKHNAEVQAQAEQSALIIGETYETNRKAIADLTAANAVLVARVRQQSAARCGTGEMSNTATATRASDATDPDDGGFFESLVDSASIADEVTETARACQAYVKNLQEVFK